ncbi:Protein of unknown function [Lactobacillus equicursoris DSM 19284 = JCM 14600 = CIP 110162]|nr:Protein of unknown function [Lactobacillus equicursoris DSM 19284 = JCM 14600 = CIP 110162]
MATFLFGLLTVLAVGHWEIKTSQVYIRVHNMRIERIIV